MQLTITLSDKEEKILQNMIERDKKFQTNVNTFEDAIHECIRMAVFDDGEM